MDMLEILKEVKNTTNANLDKIIADLDKEAEYCQNEIIAFCAQGDTESAYEMLQEHTRIAALRKFVREVQNTGRNYMKRANAQQFRL